MVGLRLYWVEFALFWAMVLGIGALVARASADRPLLKAAVGAFITALVLFTVTFVESATEPVEALIVLPTLTWVAVSIALSLMFAGVVGAVAIGLRSLWNRAGVDRSKNTTDLERARASRW